MNRIRFGNRFYFVALLAWMLCAFIVVVSGPGTTDSQMAQGAQSADAPQATAPQPSQLSLPTSATPVAPASARGSKAESSNDTVTYPERAFPSGTGSLTPDAAFAAQPAGISSEGTPSATRGSSSLDLAIISARLARPSR